MTREELEPFSVELVDTASDSRTRLVISTLVPYLVVILLVTNGNRALYVAVGEKERKTLATLLVSTAPRGAIVVGKMTPSLQYSNRGPAPSPTSSPRIS